MTTSNKRLTLTEFFRRHARPSSADDVTNAELATDLRAVLHVLPGPQQARVQAAAAALDLDHDEIATAAERDGWALRLCSIVHSYRTAGHRALDQVSVKVEIDTDLGVARAVMTCRIAGEAHRLAAFLDEDGEPDGGPGKEELRTDEDQAALAAAAYCGIHLEAALAEYLAALLKDQPSVRAAIRAASRGTTDE